MDFYVLLVDNSIKKLSISQEIQTELSVQFQEEYLKFVNEDTELIPFNVGYKPDNHLKGTSELTKE